MSTTIQGAEAPVESTQAVKPGDVAQAAPEAGSPAERSPAAQSTDGQATSQQPKREDDDLSSRFAALTRKEKKILEAERKAKEMLEKFGPLDEAISQKDALKLLERAGMSINDVLDAAIRANTEPTVEDKLKTVEQRLAEYEREKREAIEAEKKRAEMQAAEREITQFKAGIKATIDADADKFELIRLNEAYDAIYDACFEIVSADPESYPTRAEADALVPRVAELIEAELAKSMEKLKGAKKIKALFGISEEPAVESKSGGSAREAISPQSAQANPKAHDVTLTNRQASNPAEPDKRPKPLTREESLARAAAFLEAELRKKQAAQGAAR